MIKTEFRLGQDTFKPVTLEVANGIARGFMTTESVFS